MLAAQQGLLANIGSAIVEINNQDLLSPAQLPQVSIKWKQTTLDVSRQNVSSAVAAMLASTASIITLTQGDQMDTNYTAVGSAVTTISTNLTELAKAVRLLAALSASQLEGDDLLKAARALAAATTALLNAAQPENMENRQQLLMTSGEMAINGSQMLFLVGEQEVDQGTQDALVAMAKAVATATAALVTNAKNVAAKCDDMALQNQVIMAAKQTALATQGLIACTKVLAPCINSPLCQEQLIEACKLVAAAVEKIVLAAQDACKDGDALRDLGAAATAVTTALNGLIQQIKEGVRMEPGQYDEACEAILAATDRLFSSMGNAQEMVKQAKLLAEATSALVNAIKLDSENENDPDARRRLLDAARALADATSKMVEAAKGAARNPGDEQAQEALRKAAEYLRAVTNAAASNALKKKAMRKLEIAAKQTAAVSTQLIAAAQGAGASNRNEASQSQLISHCKAVAEQISQLIQSVRASIANPDSPSAQLGLINASMNMIPPAGKMVAATKAAVPTVGDQAAALQLGNFAKATAMALAALRTATSKAFEMCGSLEIDSAIDTVRNLSLEMGEAKMEAQTGQLLPLPGETVESCALELAATSKTVGSSMAQLLTAASQGNENYTGMAARDTASALRILGNAVRGVAAGTKNRQTQEYILTTAQQVMDQSCALLVEAKAAVEDPNAPNKQQRLAQAAKAVSQALNQVVNCLPGQIEFDQAIKAIAQASLSLQAEKFPDPAGASYQTLQSNLSSAAAALNATGSEVVAAARATPEQQAIATVKFAHCYEELLKAGLTLAGASKDKESQNEMLGYLRNISVSSSKLLLAAKALSADPNAPNAMNQLAAAARTVTDAINSLLNLCSSSGPGQKECDNALRNIEAVAPVLDNPNEPVSELSFFDCLDMVIEKSKMLGDAGTLITSHAKKGSIDEFGKAVESTASAVCVLTEAAAQAAYLVGISDPSSSAAIPGLVDQTRFARCNQAIATACQTLLSTSSTQQQVLASATVIAKHTSLLCNACKQASSKTSNPVAKKHFVQAAKEVANSTANLVKNIKTLASDLSEENRQSCASTTRPLLEAVEALTTFASSPQFASTPAKISEQARVAQLPIVQAGKNVIKSSSSLLTSAKSLAINPQDPPMWQLLAAHTKAVSDSIKSLILAIRDKSPGQKECDSAIDGLNATINQLDQAILSAMNQQLHPNASSNLQGFQEQLLQAVGDIGEHVKPIATAAKGEAEKLGHQVTAMCNVFPSLAGAAIGAASKTTSSQLQISLLEQTKTVTESALQLVYAAKEAGGNTKSTAVHGKVDEAALLVQTAVSELTQTLEKAGSETGIITAMVDEIRKAMARLQESPGEVSKTFMDYQTDTFTYCKAITKSVQEMVVKVSSLPQELPTYSRELTNAYSQLVNTTQCALATIDSQNIAARLSQNVQALGEVCIELVYSGGTLQTSPDDQSARRELTDSAKSVTEKVSHVLSTIQAGAVGTQACNSAITTIMSLVGDLDTITMFCTAGALHSEDKLGTFAEHRVNILETAKVLVDDTKKLVSSAAGTQEQLAEAAIRAVKTITAEAEHIKLGAASLATEDMEAQLLLLQAAKDVANALSDLIGSTRSAAGKSVQDAAMEQLKSSAKVMVAKVSNLLKTVKNVEDEAAKGVRSLENAIEAIASDLQEFESSNPPRSQATAEDLIRSTKGITLASAKAVSAGNSCKQMDITACANLSRKAVTELLETCKAASYKAENGELKSKALTSGRECATAFKALLELVHQIVLKPTYENKQNLPTFSKEVANLVGDVVQVAEQLKGSDWVDLRDPNVIAENELLQAAASIEAAAKKLSELQPRRIVRADESLTFEEQILEAAKSIASATSALVKSASAAQKELVAQGKLSSKPQSEDSQWSEGLVSAAKLVAAATSNLCEAANMVVQGHAQEDKLIAAAKSVAASTAQLLIACQVKADARSENNRRLQMAGQSVKKATETLVAAAQQAQSEETLGGRGDGAAPHIGGNVMKRFREELEIAEKIAAKERELEQARSQLTRIRKGHN